MAALFWFLLLLNTEPQNIMLIDNAGPVDVAYTATGTEIVHISAQSLADEPLDLTLEILSADNVRIAFNDDHGTVDGMLAPQDAAISGWQPAAGTYILRIHTFSGAQTGPVKLVTLTEPRLPACDTLSVSIQLWANTARECHLTLQAGQTITITAQDASGTLDPVLYLLDADNQVIIWNDDHSTSNLTLNTLDAAIEAYTAATTGDYLVRISDFSGQAGDVLLRIETQ